MARVRRLNDAVHWFMSELTSRIVADSGIPSDRFHLGKIILQSLEDAPNNIMQIDGRTGLSETNEIAMEKSVRCAVSMRSYGLQSGDVIAIMAPNHLDLAAPFYGALYLGVIIAPADWTLSVKELQRTFEISKPRIIFCQNDKVFDIKIALNDLGLDSLIVTFDTGDCVCSFSEFCGRYGVAGMNVEDFKPSDFPADDAVAILQPTSGTSGLPKYAAITHKNLAIMLPYWMATFTEFPTPTSMALLVSPLQWLTAIKQFVLSPILRYIRLQTSGTFTPEHVYHLINTYHPTTTILSPTAMTTLITQLNRDQCDFSCFEVLMLGGSAVPIDLVEQVKAITPKTEIIILYGMTETAGIVLQGNTLVPGSCGPPLGYYQYRLINVDTLEEIDEPNIPGELWLKGPGNCKGYYNDPAATAETFTEDGWIKSGDLLYRDENWNYFYIERIKSLLKYKSYQISPVEVENVIRQHPGIQDVAVTGIPDPECGDLAVACVVVRNGNQVTAEEIKGLVKESLTDSKQLRGGVVFVNELPQTTSNKIQRTKLKEMVLNMTRL